MTYPYYKVQVDTFTFEEGSGLNRVEDFDITWKYNDPVGVVIFLANHDGAFSEGGVNALAKGDIAKLWLQGDLDGTLALYLDGKIRNIRNRDDGIMEVTARGFYDEAMEKFNQNIFFENFLDKELYEIQRTAPRQISLDDSSLMTSSDIPIVPLKAVYILAGAVPKNLRTGGVWQRVGQSGFRYAQRFTSHSKRLQFVYMAFRRGVTETLNESYYVGIAPTDSSGEPDTTNYFKRISWSPTNSDIETATTWIQFDLSASTDLEVGKEYWIFIYKYTTNEANQELDIMYASSNQYGEFWEYSGGAWTGAMTGKWLNFVAFGDEQVTWQQLEYGRDYLMNGVDILIDDSVDLVIQPNANASRPILAKVHTYFQDADANQQNVFDVIQAICQMAWKNAFTYTINANFNNDTNYRLPFYLLQGLSLLDALKEIAKVSGQLTGGKEGWIYEDYTGTAELNFNEALTTSDAEGYSVNKDNGAQDADGAMNTNHPLGQVVSLELDEIVDEIYDKVRVTPKDFSNMVELTEYGIVPDYGKTFEHIDNGIADLVTAINRAEELREVLSNQAYEGEMEITGWWPHFGGSRDFSCGDIIKIKASDKLSAPTKFKIMEVSITSEHKTTFRITNSRDLRTKLKSHSDRIKELERTTSPQGIYDMFIAIRKNQSDTLTGTVDMKLKENGGTVIAEAECTKITRTGHNLYHAYFPPTWLSHSSLVIGDPIVDIVLDDGATTIVFDVEDFGEDSYIPPIYKYGFVRLTICFVVGTA